MKGILLDENNDAQILVKRDAEEKIISGLVVGETKIQDAYMVLSINQGDLKEDPIVGCNLITMIRSRSKTDKEKLKKTIKIGLKRVGIEHEDIKSELTAIINKETVDL